MYPASFQQLIEMFRKLPQVGAKAAERYAFAVLALSEQDCGDFAEIIKKVKATVHPCEICFNLSEEATCSICQDQSREQELLCVVNSARDIIAMENTGIYRGLYHVLGGEISPTKGIMPDDLTIKQLLTRLTAGIKEVIIATNSTIDGETTALYLSKLITKEGVAVSRLAHGLPMGGQLDYADEMTLVKALQGRIKY